jgi:hypothetical protein
MHLFRHRQLIDYKATAANSLWPQSIVVVDLGQ